MERWYAVYTQNRMEKWARSNLWERGFEVYLPQYSKRRRHARRTDRVAAPLFPRYLFVRADLEQGARRAIRTAPGVADMVAFSNTPVPVADAVIAELRAREGDDGLVSLASLAEHYELGEKLRINSGAFSDQFGFFNGLDDRNRVLLLLDLLGRRIPVRIPAGDVGRNI